MLSSRIILSFLVESSLIIWDGVEELVSHGKFSSHMRQSDSLIPTTSFKSRDVCEEVIKEFHYKHIDKEGLQLQVRYADTPAQKELKGITKKGREFRTDEYSMAVNGNPL